MFKKMWDYCYATFGVIIAILLVALAVGISFAFCGLQCWICLWIFGVASVFTWGGVFKVWLILLTWSIIKGIINGVSSSD